MGRIVLLRSKGYWFHQYGPSAWQRARKRNPYVHQLIRTYNRDECYPGIDEGVVDRKVGRVLLLSRWKNYMRYPAWIGRWLWACAKYGCGKLHAKAVDLLGRLR